MIDVTVVNLERILVLEGDEWSRTVTTEVAQVVGFSIDLIEVPEITLSADCSVDRKAGASDVYLMDFLFADPARQYTYSLIHALAVRRLARHITC